jgi:DNA replication protein DnaC
MTPVLDPDLTATLRRLKLGQVIAALPERLALAKTNKLGHAEFLLTVLADEVARRDSTSATLRAKAAGLDPTMQLDRWDSTTAVTYDRALLDELVSLRFIEAAHNIIVMGPVGVGKTFVATALGHTAIRQRHSVHFERTDRLLKRLRVSRLDNSHDAEIRKLLRVDVLILDDFALSAMDPNDTTDIYEVIVERHRRASTIITSNREPNEWIALMADPLLAQSAIDRIASAAHELIIEGDSYRTRQRPQHP